MHHQDEGLGFDLADQGADATWPMMGLAELWKMARLVGTVTGDPRDCASEGVMGQHHYQKVLGEAREVCAEGAGVAGNAGGSSGGRRSVRKGRAWPEMQEGVWPTTPAPTPSGHRPPAAAESVLPCPSLLRLIGASVTPGTTALLCDCLSVSFPAASGAKTIFYLSRIPWYFVRYLTKAISQSIST